MDIYNLFIQLITNKVFLAVLLAVLSSQGLKIILTLFSEKRFIQIKDLFVTGGMPSSHSAIVIGLATSILLTEGATTTFVFATVLALIVIRDAMGVRRTAGEEGQMIDIILQKLHLKVKDFHYSMGHTPMQVLIGSIMGLLSGIVISLI